MLLVLVRFDSFLESLVNPFGGWPTVAGGTWLAKTDETRIMFLLITWAPIVVGGAIVQAVLLWLITSVSQWHFFPERSPQRPMRKRITWSILVGLSAAVMAPRLFIFFQLMNPGAIPETPTADSNNGWHEIVAAMQMAESSPEIEVIHWHGSASMAQLESAVRALEPAYKRLSKGMQLPVRIPLNYESEGELRVDVLSGQRTLSRLLVSRGRVAESRGRVHEAAQTYMQALEHGFAIRRGGLMVDALVGIACSTGSGLHHLHDCHTKLTRSECLDLIAALEKIERTIEPTAMIIEHDRLWSRHVYGWHGHLAQLLNDVTMSESSTESGFRAACRNELTDLRLLKTELAIQARRMAKGSLPETLEELVPEYLSQVPRDPMASPEASLQYRRLDHGFLLYSVGADGVDNGGVPAERWPRSGDYRLDVVYDTGA